MNLHPTFFVTSFITTHIPPLIPPGKNAMHLQYPGSPFQKQTTPLLAPTRKQCPSDHGDRRPEGRRPVHAGGPRNRTLRLNQPPQAALRVASAKPTSPSTLV
jgi:hypothetical protein